MKVLDKGTLELVDVLGSDTTVVNAARVSFAKQVSAIGESDEKLVNYLAKHKHISPFYHPHLTFRVKAPISVQRQWFKHKIGTAENSESTRYVEVTDEFYVPAVMRAQSSSNKQGSSGPLPDDWIKPHGNHAPEEQRHDWAREQYKEACEYAFLLYRRLIDLGVAKEQAREVLPLCTYTSWVWTASLAAVVHFIRLRDEEHAQFEIREYAKAMRALTEQHFPVSLKALLEN